MKFNEKGKIKNEKNKYDHTKEIVDHIGNKKRVALKLGSSERQVNRLIV